MEMIEETADRIPPAGCLNRIVIVERGPLTSRSDLFCGRDQKLFSQAGTEPLTQFAERIARRLRNGDLSREARALLGDEADMSARRTMLRNLASTLVGAEDRVLELIVPAGSVASESALHLLDELTQDDAFRKVPVRLRRVC